MHIAKILLYRPRVPVPGTVDGGGGSLHLHSKVLYCHTFHLRRASAFRHPTWHLSPIPDHSVHSVLAYLLLVPDWFRHRYFFRYGTGPAECRRVRPNTGESGRKKTKKLYEGITVTFAAQHDLRGNDRKILK
jgi:hypothetical protein